MKKFDLFRLNCFLNDVKASDFKLIIVSLVSEYIFDKNNECIDIEDCYRHIIDFHKISIDRDLFDTIISKSSNFKLEKLDNNVFLSLKVERFNKIDDDLNNHSIEIYIRHFIKDNQYDIKYIDVIKSILYKAVYENINSFSPENLLSLISDDIKEDFNQNEIEIFNKFLEYQDSSKNTAIYNVFLKAIEYAIITSNRGIKEFSKDIFKGKKYLLDTNILFRLLGVGGEERKQSIYDLIKTCISQGITFEYTGETYQEFLKTLSGTIKFLKVADSKYDIDTLGYVIEKEPNLIKQDFVSHYSRLKLLKKVSTPEKYELLIRTELSTIFNSLNISLAKSISQDSKKVDILSQELLNNKKKLPYELKYTEKASKVDAYNIIYVRKLRGNNNYNYKDVISFYLTTDRSLNKILSKNESSTISETILPSQLFLLHFPYMSNEDGEIDYTLFLKFIKRRTTEYNLRGSQVLNYIKEIRTITNSEENISTILKVYADQRFDNLKTDKNENRIFSIKEITEKITDKKIQDGKIAQDNLDAIRESAYNRLPKIFNSTKTTIIILDIAIMVIFIPFISILLRKIITNFTIITSIFILLEFIKYIVLNKMKFINHIWKKYFIYRLESAEYFIDSKDSNFVKEGMKLYDSVDGDVWKNVWKIKNSTKR